MILKYIIKLLSVRDCVKTAFKLISFAFFWDWFSKHILN